MKSLFLIIAFCTLLRSDIASVCTCEENESIEVEIEASDLVITGEVIGKRIISKIKQDKKDIKQKIYLISYEIKVDKAFKGVKSDKKILLYTSKGAGSCGLNLETNQKYIIFAQRGTFLPNRLEFFLDDFEKHSFWASSCSKTSPYSDEIVRAIAQKIN